MARHLLVPDRRHFLKNVSGASLLAPPGMRFVQGLAQSAPDLTKKHKFVFFCWMGGGPTASALWGLTSRMASAGVSKPINTAASVMHICEHLPSVAKQMKRLSVFRSLETTEGDPNLCTVLMNT